MIYSKLLKARKLLGLTQMAVAEGSGILQKDISLLETGQKEFIPADYIQYLYKQGIDINSLYDDSIEEPRKIVENRPLAPPDIGQSITGQGTAQQLSPSKSPYDVSQNVSPTVSPTQKSGKKSQKLSPKTSGISSPEEARFNLGAPKVVVVNDRGQENIVYVPVKARAGYLSGYGDPSYLSSLQSFRLPGFNNATYRMFEVDGPSMAPTISHGDKIVAQWVPSFDEIRENRVHTIVTRHGGIVIKRVLNRIAQRGKIVLKSDTINHRSEYPTFEIDPEDILEIWYGVLRLSADFSEPAEVYHRINDLEADVVEIKQINKDFMEQIQAIREEMKSGRKKSN